MCFAVWEAEVNGICEAIHTLFALPKPVRDRLLPERSSEEISVRRVVAIEVSIFGQGAAYPAG